MACATLIVAKIDAAFTSRFFDKIPKFHQCQPNGITSPEGTYDADKHLAQ